MSKEDKIKDTSRWKDLVLDPNFKAIFDYRDDREKILRSENKELNVDPSPTNLNKINANLARIAEIDALIARANFYKRA